MNCLLSTPWLLLFTSPVSGFKFMADWCIIGDLHTYHGVLYITSAQVKKCRMSYLASQECGLFCLSGFKNNAYTKTLFTARKHRNIISSRTEWLNTDPKSGIEWPTPPQISVYLSSPSPSFCLSTRLPLKSELFIADRISDWLREGDVICSLSPEPFFFVCFALSSLIDHWNVHKQTHGCLSCHQLLNHHFDCNISYTYQYYIA